MGTAALGARLALALVFATAAAGKLADRSGTRRTLADFGVARRSLVPLAFLLPLAELGTAAALVFQPSARWGAVAAVALLLVFAAGIAAAMARGEAPDCHCFGQISSAPAGPRTLIRNAVLAAPVVLVIAYGPGAALDTWITARSAAELVALGTGISTVALAAASVHLWFENRRVSRDLASARETIAGFPPGLFVGVRAPNFALSSTDGRTVTLDALLVPGKPVALVFVSFDCGPCTVMLADVSRWQTRLADRLTIALPTKGTVRELGPLAAQHRLENVLADERSEVFNAYRGWATPSVVIVAPDGTIASQVGSTHAIVEAMIRRAVSDDTMPPAPGSGTIDGRPFEVLQPAGARGPD